MDLEALKYPIGRFKRPEAIDAEMIDQWIAEIEQLPYHIRNAVTGLTDEQLDTPYRPEGWTIRQVVHHLPDSHMNSYIRFRWALTEDTPVIKAYYEDRWAEMRDNRDGEIEPSLQLLDALHGRWAMLLRSLSPEDLQKSFAHPETKREVRLDVNIALYAWHGQHHLAHIENCIRAMNNRAAGDGE